MKCSICTNIADLVQRLAMTNDVVRGRAVATRGTFLAPSVVRLGLTSGRPAVNEAALDLFGFKPNPAVTGEP